MPKQFKSTEPNYSSEEEDNITEMIKNQSSKKLKNNNIKSKSNLSILPTNKVNTENQIKAETQNETLSSRQQHFLCLCKTLNMQIGGKEIITNWLTRYIYGTTVYIWLIVIGILVAHLGALGYLTYYYINTTTVNKSYFVQCTSNSDCDISIGLHCSVESDICNCPAKNTTGRCDCNRGYYWNGTYCAQLLQYLDKNCANDYNCDQTKELRCVNNICTCDSTKVWNASTLICEYSYVGCCVDNRFNYYLQTVNSKFSKPYFVELCMDICYKFKWRYAHMGITGGGLNTCFCEDSYNTTTKATCETKCSSGSYTKYTCGSATANSNTRSIYNTLVLK